MVAFFSDQRTAGGAAVFTQQWGDGGFSVSPSGLASAATFGAPTFAFTFPFAVAPTGLASTLAIGFPTVARQGQFSVAPSGLASRAAIGAPLFAFSDGTVTPTPTPASRRLTAAAGVRRISVVA